MKRAQNAVAAHTCQQGGYASVVGVQGDQVVTFANTGQCVSFAAQGGHLVPLSVAQPCLNGGYVNDARGDTTHFTSAAACVAYAGLDAHVEDHSGRTKPAAAATTGRTSSVYSIPADAAAALAAAVGGAGAAYGEGLVALAARSSHAAAAVAAGPTAVRIRAPAPAGGLRAAPTRDPSGRPAAAVVPGAPAAPTGDQEAIAQATTGRPRVLSWRQRRRRRGRSRASVRGRGCGAPGGTETGAWRGGSWGRTGRGTSRRT